MVSHWLPPSATYNLGGNFPLIQTMTPSSRGRRSCAQKTGQHHET